MLPVTDVGHRSSHDSEVRPRRFTERIHVRRQQCSSRLRAYVAGVLLEKYKCSIQLVRDYFFHACLAVFQWPTNHGFLGSVPLPLGSQVHDRQSAITHREDQGDGRTRGESLRRSPALTNQPFPIREGLFIG